MRLIKNLSWFTAVIAVGALAASGLTAFWLYVTDVAVEINGWLYLKTLISAMVVFGLGWMFWDWLKLNREIASIIRQLKDTGPPNEDMLTAGEEKQQELNTSHGAQITGPGLGKLLDDRLDRDSECIKDLEKRVEDLQIHTRLLERQKRNTEEIIYSIRDAVIAIDEFGKVLLANEAAGKLFGFNHEDSEHKKLSELIDADKKEFAGFLQKGRQSKVGYKRKEIEFTIGDNLKVYDCIISCTYDASKKVSGVIAVLHDVTREKEVSQMKNDFVSHVSHELKTPLASITAYSEMLVDGEAQDENMRKEFYSVIQSQAKRLNRLIEDVLNISRIESGMVKIDKKSLSLTVLIEEQLQMISTYAQEKGIQIITDKPIVQEQVNADRDMMSQIIINLLSNAVKYTNSGGSVKVVTEVDEDKGVVRVLVSDTGVGIPEDEIEHVFDKFYRVGKNKRKAKGTGLGLNLVKQIVEKVHKGRVFVSSEQGQGSTFGFELPLAKAEAIEMM